MSFYKEGFLQIIQSDGSLEQKIMIINQRFMEIESSMSTDSLKEIKSIMDNQYNIDWRLKIFINSFFLHILHKPEYLHNIADLMEVNEEIQLKEFYFLYWQLTRRIFLSSHLDNVKIHNRMRNLYKKMFSFYNEQMTGTNYWIPYDERNKDVVIVFTNQLLSLHHAPTKIALDTCYTLVNNLNKEVVLINTADLPRSSQLPYYSPQFFNYASEYNEYNQVTYKDVNIPFYQFTREMPDDNEVDLVLQKVMMMKPLFILSIGNSNITADLCSNFVPVITIPIRVEIPISEGTFLMLPRKLRDDDAHLIASLTQPPNRIIESDISYSKVEGIQKKSLRADFGLEDNYFVIALVGNRLHDELTDDLLLTYDKFLKDNPSAHFLIVGDYKDYDKCAEKYTYIKDQSKYIGFQDNLSEALSLCDIYLNPPRSGGGTSAAYALNNGIPVFTPPCGDVSYVARNEYHIESIDVLSDYIKNWKNSKFKQKEQEKAFERAREIFDPESNFINVIKNMMQLSAFY